MTQPDNAKSKPPRAEPPAQPRRYGRYVVGAAILALIGYAATGFYVVQPQQRAVVRRFGAIVEPQAQPGVHYAFPFPIGRVDVLRTSEPRRATVGMDAETRAAIIAGDLVAMRESPATDVFTGDVNIVKATMVANYQISRPDRYVAAAIDPDRLVRLAVLSSMIETLESMTIDAALAKDPLRIEEVRTKAQQILQTYDCGIALMAVNLEGIEPPQAAAEAFRDVTSADKERERTMDAARADADSIRTRAKGAAAEQRAAAEGYRQTTINKAKGQTKRFNALLAEYERAPQVTRLRLLIDTLTRVYENAEIYVLSPADDGPPMRLTITNTK